MVRERGDRIGLVEVGTERKLGQRHRLAKRHRQAVREDVGRNLLRGLLKHLGLGRQERFGLREIEIGWRAEMRRHAFRPGSRKRFGILLRERRLLLQRRILVRRGIDGVFMAGRELLQRREVRIAKDQRGAKVVRALRGVFPEVAPELPLVRPDDAGHADPEVRVRFLEQVQEHSLPSLAHRVVSRVARAAHRVRGKGVYVDLRQLPGLPTGVAFGFTLGSKLHGGVCRGGPVLDCPARPIDRRVGGHLIGLRSHDVGLALQRGVVVDRQVLRRRRRCHPVLKLLHHVPGLVRQEPLLPGRDMDLHATGIRSRVQLLRSLRVVVDSDPVDGDPGQLLDVGLERIGEPGFVSRNGGRCVRFVTGG
jgi:hypothetical protein